jgi:hypothetical protein
MLFRMRLTHGGGFDLCAYILLSAVLFISSVMTVAVA